MRSILTDQGAEFVNKINDKLCEVWNVKHKVTAAYHPQTNGLDEKTNQTLKSALSKYVNEHQSDWDEWIDDVLFALRTKRQASTKYSPFFLLYGREAQYPSQLPDKVHTEDELPACPSDEFIEQEIEMRKTSITSTSDQVQENVSKAKLKQQKDFKKRQSRKYVEFKVGDKVLKYDAAKDIRKARSNLGPKYLGPYIICEIVGSKVSLETLGGVKLKKSVSADHLKLFVEEDSNVEESIKTKMTNYISTVTKEGLLNRVFDLSTKIDLKWPKNIAHCEISQACPVLDLIRQTGDESSEMVTEMMPLVLAAIRDRDINSLTWRTNLTAIITSVLVYSYQQRTCPLEMMETLKTRPSHLACPRNVTTIQDSDRLSVGGETIEKNDLMSLDDNNWLNDKIVNAFLQMKKVDKNKGHQHVFMVPSYVYQLWTSGKHDSWLFKKVRFLPFKHVMLPVCTNDHWVLLVASPHQRILTVYDSLGRRNDSYFKNWLSFMNARNSVCEEKLEGWELEFGRCSMQKDGNNCGTFVLMNAEAIMADKSPTLMRQVHCQQYRRYIKEQLLYEGTRRQEDRCDWLDCTGQHVDWIQCSCCNRWLHSVCADIDIESVDTDFICVICDMQYA